MYKEDALAFNAQFGPIFAQPIPFVPFVLNGTNAFMLIAAANISIPITTAHMDAGLRQLNASQLLNRHAVEIASNRVWTTLTVGMVCRG